ncbi:ABC transporter permease [Priestia taiwanensis]|uniref:Peptide ABC transporter permease n=1 Tax=Priestia taiwanensis TaxID=1347902 RepID=A0A917ES09_9BACI|nr:ABC transporter permease [Priestia taiwanensis]MBM7365257.1 peptide/nickel transport system permease protein [Priestia taiwanensis]GGE85765.1 peptide ABC transporter permease [Priestia taiwanensis]
MKQFVVRRFLQMIPTLFGVSIIIFFLFALVPGDFLDSNLKLTPERAAELRALYGLDKPIIERYFTWLGGVLKGDFGYSLQYQESVTSLLGKYIWNSFILAIVTLVLTWTIALVIGIVTATKQYSWFDGVVTLFVFVAMAFPSFFFALLMIKVFSVDFAWLPIGGMTDTGSTATGFAYFLDVAEHMILPVLVLTLLGVGSLTRYFRTSMIDVVHQNFIRTARAKGLKERTVIYKHALKNAILPAITLLSFELPGLFAGAIIAEKIFSWPGVGSMYLGALEFRDYPVLMGFTMFLAILTILSNFLADILYAVADPRIRLK